MLFITVVGWFLLEGIRIWEFLHCVYGFSAGLTWKFAMSVHLCLHVWGLIVYSLIQGRWLCFSTHWPCNSSFVPRLRKPLLQLSQNVWVKISVSGGLWFCILPGGKIRLTLGASKMRTYFSTFQGVGWGGVGHICTLKTKKYQWSNSFSCTWVLGNHCAGSRGDIHIGLGQMWMQFRGMHAWWLISSGREHAEWVAVTGPFFADFKDSNKTKTSPASSCPPPPHPVP